MHTIVQLNAMTWSDHLEGRMLRHKRISWALLDKSRTTIQNKKTQPENIEKGWKEIINQSWGDTPLPPHFHLLQFIQRENWIGSSSLSAKSVRTVQAN